MLDPENRNKVGIGLIAGSGIFFFLGIILLFERSLLIIGNLCFLAGLYFLVGLTGTINFFFKNKKGRVQGTVLYLAGFFWMIISSKFIFAGFLIQLIGLLFVFRDFLPWLKGYTFNLPFIGKYECIDCPRRKNNRYIVPQEGEPGIKKDGFYKKDTFPPNIFM